MSQPETPMGNASNTELKTWVKPSLTVLEYAIDDVLGGAGVNAEGFGTFTS
jgi:hypothetical protein